MALLEEQDWRKESDRHEKCFLKTFLHSLWEAVIAKVAVDQKKSSCLELLQSMHWMRNGRFRIVIRVDRGHKAPKAKAAFHYACVRTRVSLDDLTFGEFELKKFVKTSSAGS